MTRDQLQSDGAASPTLGRRGFLAAGLGAGAVALAGCSNVVNFFGNIALSDLNVFNGTDQQLTGHASVTDPSGETVHDQDFELAPEGESGQDNSGEEEGNFEPYEDVFTEEGEYTIAIELAAGETVDGVGQAEDTVRVTAPDDEHIVAFLGSEEGHDGIYIDVINKLTDLDDGDNSTD
jgi:hypothetical protein